MGPYFRERLSSVSVLCLRNLPKAPSFSNLCLCLCVLGLRFKRDRSFPFPGYRVFRPSLPDSLAKNVSRAGSGAPAAHAGTRRRIVRETYGLYNRSGFPMQYPCGGRRSVSPRNHSFPAKVPGGTDRRLLSGGCYAPVCGGRYFSNSVGSIGLSIVIFSQIISRAISPPDHITSWNGTLIFPTRR